MSEKSERAYEWYLLDLAHILRERGSKACRDAAASGLAFDEGRAAAYREVLSWMQAQADTFGLSREPLCLAGFDAMTDELAPPSPPEAGGIDHT